MKGCREPGEVDGEDRERIEPDDRRVPRERRIGSRAARGRGREGPDMEGYEEMVVMILEGRIEGRLGIEEF